MDWHTYFITMCFLVAQKSKDQSTKCGCVATTTDHVILSTGYNGPPRGFPDDLAPQTRPAKYGVFEHAERNCIYSAAREGINLKGSTFYITGPACGDCMRAMIQVGAKKIVYGVNTAVMFNEEARKLNELLLTNQQIEVVQHSDVDGIIATLNQTNEYINKKIKTV